MEVICISGVNLLPQSHAYREYRGQREECIKEHTAKYPHFTPPMCFWIEARKSLFVPMEWNRTEIKHDCA